MSKTVEETIIFLTNDLVQDWGLDDIDITRDILLKEDLGFSSADTMQLFAAIQEHYNEVEFKFQDLVMVSGKIVGDLSIAQVTAHVLKTLDQAINR